ncbi:site-specific integrase [Bacteriovoracaceae bacterium]|nr:site-specific integrase [Bacteriovoracaceae bacterium]
MIYLLCSLRYSYIMSNIVNTSYNIHKEQRTTWESAEEIIREGTSKNSLKAIKTDLSYFWRWYRVSYDESKNQSYPIPVKIIITFVVDHIKGLPPHIDKEMVARKYKNRLGPHSLNTVTRRVSSLSRAHTIMNFKNPCLHPSVRLLLAKAERNPDRTKLRRKKGITADILKMFLNEPDQSIKNIRDQAILYIGFASGGRRRSEIVELNFEDITPIEDGYKILIKRAKSDQKGKGHYKPLKGKGGIALQKWISVSKIASGPLFRSMTKSGSVLNNRLSSRAVSEMIKCKAKMAGFDPEEFGGHSLRRGFATECGKKGIDPITTMRLMGLKTIAMLDTYREEGEVESSTLHVDLFGD